MDLDRPILLNKVFTVKSPRPNSSVYNIADAYSEALSQISDQMLLEIQEVIINDQLNKEEKDKEQQQKIDPPEESDDPIK